MATTIHVTLGKPGSGKSTWAKGVASRDDSILRVNKDEIRSMLYTTPYTREKEEVVDAIERAAIFSALGRGYDIIVDATNFNLDRLKTFSKEYSGHPAYLHWFQADLETCLDRNAKREIKVPDNVIEDMAVKEAELVAAVAFDVLFDKVITYP